MSRIKFSHPSTCSTQHSTNQRIFYKLNRLHKQRVYIFYHSFRSIEALALWLCQETQTPHLHLANSKDAIQAYKRGRSTQNVMCIYNRIELSMESHVSICRWCCFCCTVSVSVFLSWFVITKQSCSTNVECRRFVLLCVYHSVNECPIRSSFCLGSSFGCCC